MVLLGITSNGREENKRNVSKLIIRKNSENTLELQIFRSCN